LFEVGDTYKDENGLLAGYDRTRRVVVTEQEEIVGYLWSWRAPWTERGYLNNTLVVAEAYREQGIGQLLFQHILEWSASLGASKLVTDTWDDNPAALRFAEHRGFKIERQAYQSVLKLAQIELDNTYDDLLGVMVREGIQFTTLAEELGEDSEQKLYGLYKETLVDIPGYTGEVPNIDDWRKWYLMAEGYAPERVIIATDGDKYVGVTNVLFKPQTNGMYHEYTGVSRAYRGRKIALALKMKAILLAKQLNAAYIRTDNDSTNKPILSINRQLGYEPLRGSYMLLATL
jgi:GNAT superfamily N-acetyltransferase